MKTQTPINILLIILSLVTIFHFCIIFKFIPYNIAWGGRLQNDSEMYVFECISILINGFLAWVLLMKGGLLSFRFKPLTLNIILWIFFALFILNTIGNIFAKTTFEKFFAFLTLILALLIWLIQKKEKHIN